MEVLSMNLTLSDWVRFKHTLELQKQQLGKQLAIMDYQVLAASKEIKRRERAGESITMPAKPEGQLKKAEEKKNVN